MPMTEAVKKKFVFYLGIGLELPMYGFCWFKNLLHWKCKAIIHFKI